MYLTRIAGIETVIIPTHQKLAAMYLTRIAGIETRYENAAELMVEMYLTRIAGIETAKLPFVFLWMLSDVSYPNNGN